MSSDILILFSIWFVGFFNVHKDTTSKTKDNLFLHQGQRFFPQLSRKLGTVIECLEDFLTRA
jgi:hypothetical protein